MRIRTLQVLGVPRGISSNNPETLTRADIYCWARRSERHGLGEEDTFTQREH